MKTHENTINNYSYEFLSRTLPFIQRFSLAISPYNITRSDETGPFFNLLRSRPRRALVSELPLFSLFSAVGVRIWVLSSSALGARTSEERICIVISSAQNLRANERAVSLFSQEDDNFSLAPFTHACMHVL